ncbi:hypothetical protein M406DRAFT_242106, partial [Cryphonectria parasitica EP155]
SLSLIASSSLTSTVAATSAAASVSVTPTLPSTGSTDLPAPESNLTLLYVAVGHGIQNYTCADDSTATAVNTGALAVLYDVTSLYPGLSSTSMSSTSWANMTSAVLWDQAIPLNLVDPAAGDAVVAKQDDTTYPESSYNADSADPFPSPAAALDLSEDGLSASYLGHHYFDSESSPTFNLAGAATAGLFFSAKKVGDVAAPTTADSGLLDTKAVDWLELADSGRGLSVGISNVYRVVTAGGGAEACSVSGASGNGTFSVPYTAQYWFY